MTHPNHLTNGASLEDCHTNFFALTDLCGIKWRKLVLGERPNASSDPLDDPVLRSYSRCLAVDILCVWRRVASPKPEPDQPGNLFEISLSGAGNSGSVVHPPLSLTAAKELWIFWYGEEPDLTDLLAPELLKSSELAKEDTKNWSLRKYVKSLDTMIKELATSEDKPNRSILDEYYHRCDKLKTTINHVEQSFDSRKLKVKTRDAAAGDSVLKEINQIQNEHYHSQMRKELLDSQNDLQSGSRKRGGVTTTNGDNMGQAMKYYGDMQEKIAEDMLSLTRSLKEQTEIANKIIRKDTEIVTKSTLLSDKNMSSLASEADKLQEHSKRAWKCWMWIMIGMVMMIFIFMVLFMKITKKKL